jgi:hypothetical protein
MNWRVKRYRRRHTHSAEAKISPPLWISRTPSNQIIGRRNRRECSAELTGCSARTWTRRSARTWTRPRMLDFKTPATLLLAKALLSPAKLLRWAAVVTSLRGARQAGAGGARGGRERRRQGESRSRATFRGRDARPAGRKGRWWAPIFSGRPRNGRFGALISGVLLRCSYYCTRRKLRPDIVLPGIVCLSIAREFGLVEIDLFRLWTFWVAGNQGLKMLPIFLKIIKIWRDRSGLNLKIFDFLNLTSKISKK